MHDPDLGVAVEDARAAKPEHLLPASGAPHADPIAHEVAVSLLDNVTDMNADAKFDTPFRRPARIAPGRAGPLRRAGGLERPPGHFFTSKGGPAVLHGLADGFRVGVGDLALGVGAPELAGELSEAVISAGVVGGFWELGYWGQGPRSRNYR